MVRLRGVLGGGVLAAVVVALRQWGLLDGWLAAVVAAIAVLAVPTSRLLARRILLAGLLLLGWVPLLWWWHLPVGSVGRVTLLLAVLVGGLGGWVLADRPGERLRRLNPDWRAVDLLPFGAGLGSIAVLHDWLTVSEPARALGILLSGWDNAAHFDMTFLIRTGGVTVDGLGLAPDGTSWNFANYPQAFHTVIATLVELLNGPRVGDAPVEPVGYVHAEALLFGILPAVVIAGLVSLPHLRRHFGLCLVATAAIVAVLVIGPGAAYQFNGNQNYVLALSLCMAVAALLVVISRPLQPLPLAALAGGVVGIANGWSLLLLVVLPGALGLLLPWRRGRWSASRTDLVWAAVISGGAVVGLLHSARVLLAVHSTSFASIPGYTPSGPAWQAFAVVGGAAALALSVGIRTRRRELSRLPKARIVALAAMPLSGLLVSAVLAGLELHSVHQLSYYFWKVFGGVEVISFAVLVSSLSYRVDRWHLPVRPVLRGAVLVVAAAGLTQIFGYFGPGLYVSVGGRTTASSASRLVGYAEGVRWHGIPVARHLIAAIPVQEQHPSEQVVYLALGPWDDDNAANVEEWFWAVTRTWSVHVRFAGNVPPLHLQGVKDGAVVAKYVLPSNPKTLIVVPPEVVGALRAAIADPNLRPRIVTW